MPSSRHLEGPTILCNNSIVTSGLSSKATKDIIIKKGKLAEEQKQDVPDKQKQEKIEIRETEKPKKQEGKVEVQKKQKPEKQKKEKKTSRSSRRSIGMARGRNSTHQLYPTSI
jgi:hypothetical protein